MSLQQCCKIENTLNQSPLRKNQQLADLVSLTPQVQGQAADIGGYYAVDTAKVNAVMRPSSTLNATLETI